MLKPIAIMYPVIPARDEEERAALRPIGRHRDRYQAAMRGMTRSSRQPTRWASGVRQRPSTISGPRAMRSRPPGGDQRLLAGQDEKHPYRATRLCDEHAQSDPRGRGGGGHRPPVSRPHVCRLRPRLSVALDEYTGSALWRPRNEIAVRRHLQSANHALRLLAGDSASERPGRRCP